MDAITNSLRIPRRESIRNETIKQQIDIKRQNNRRYREGTANPVRACKQNGRAETFKIDYDVTTNRKKKKRVRRNKFYFTNFYQQILTDINKIVVCVINFVCKFFSLLDQ